MIAQLTATGTRLPSNDKFLAVRVADPTSYFCRSRGGSFEEFITSEKTQAVFYKSRVADPTSFFSLWLSKHSKQTPQETLQVGSLPSINLIRRWQQNMDKQLEKLKQKQKKELALCVGHLSQGTLLERWNKAKASLQCVGSFSAPQLNSRWQNSKLQESSGCVGSSSTRTLHSKWDATKILANKDCVGSTKASRLVEAWRESQMRFSESTIGCSPSCDLKMRFEHAQLSICTIGSSTPQELLARYKSHYQNTQDMCGSENREALTKRYQKSKNLQTQSMYGYQKAQSLTKHYWNTKSEMLNLTGSASNLDLVHKWQKEKALETIKCVGCNSQQNLFKSFVDAKSDSVGVSGCTFDLKERWNDARAQECTGCLSQDELKEKWQGFQSDMNSTGSLSSVRNRWTNFSTQTVGQASVNDLVNRWSALQTMDSVGNLQQTQMSSRFDSLLASCKQIA